MFLHELSDDAYVRTLFLECAYILLEAQNSQSYLNLREDWHIEEKFIPEFIVNEDFMPILNSYAIAFDNSLDTKNPYYINNEKNYAIFLKEKVFFTVGGCYKIDEKNRHIERHGGNSSDIFMTFDMTSAEDAIAKASRQSTFPSLYNMFGYISGIELDKSKESAETRQIVLQQLIANNFDLLNINPKVINEMTLSLSEVKEKILHNMIDLIFVLKSEYVVGITNKERKIIIFELIKLCLSHSKFGPIEKILISAICQHLKVDQEYIDEFEDIINQLLIISKEAKDLIIE